MNNWGNNNSSDEGSVFSLNSNKGGDIVTDLFSYKRYTLRNNIDIHFSNSSLIAKCIINEIIEDAVDIGLTNYYNQRIPDFLLDMLKTDINHTMNLEFITYDKNTKNKISKYNNIDNEPIPIKIDNWGRSVVKEISIKKEIIKNKSEFNSDYNTNNSLQSKKIKKTTENNIKKDLKTMNPIELYERKDFISVEEKNLRVLKDKQLKELELKKKEEKIRKDVKEKEKIENERKLREGKVKEYTYDSEGRLIQILPMKPDKLNNIVLAPRAKIKRKSVENNNDDNKNNKQNKKHKKDDNNFKSGPLPALKRLHLKNEELNKNQVDIKITKNIFDMVEVQTGVTYIEGNRKKAGPLMSTMLETTNNFKLTKTYLNNFNNVIKKSTSNKQIIRSRTKNNISLKRGGSRINKFNNTENLFNGNNNKDTVNYNTTGNNFDKISENNINLTFYNDTGFKKLISTNDKNDTYTNFLLKTVKSKDNNIDNNLKKSENESYNFNNTKDSFIKNNVYVQNRNFNKINKNNNKYKSIKNYYNHKRNSIKENDNYFKYN